MTQLKKTHSNWEQNDICYILHTYWYVNCGPTDNTFFMFFLSPMYKDFFKIKNILYLFTSVKRDHGTPGRLAMNNEAMTRRNSTNITMGIASSLNSFHGSESSDLTEWLQI